MLLHVTFEEMKKDPFINTSSSSGYSVYSTSPYSRLSASVSHYPCCHTNSLHVFLHYILKPSLWSFTIHSPYIQSLYSHLQASSCPSISLTVNMPSPSTLFLSSSNSTLVSSTQQGHEKYTGLWLPLLIGYILITSTSEMNFISTSNNLCPIWHEFCLDQGC